MRLPSQSQDSRGMITLFTAMMILLLTSLLMMAAFKLSSTNLAAVGNVQTRAGAIAAAEKVIADILGEEPGVSTLQAARVEVVDINRDGAGDYRVDVPPSRCVRAMPAAGNVTNSVSLPGLNAAGAWNTVWEINAVATDEATGASVSVVQGIRYLLTDAEKRAVCD